MIRNTERVHKGNVVQVIVQKKYVQKMKKKEMEMIKVSELRNRKHIDMTIYLLKFYTPDSYLTEINTTYFV